MEIHCSKSKFQVSTTVKSEYALEKVCCNSQFRLYVNPLYQKCVKTLTFCYVLTCFNKSGLSPSILIICKLDLTKVCLNPQLLVCINTLLRK